MVVDFLTFAAPCLPGVFELTDEFLFLCIDAYSWVSRVAELVSLFSNVLKLLVAFLELFPGMSLFAMASKSQLLVTQQPTDGRRAGSAIQFFRKSSQTGSHPLFLRTRITGRFAVDTCEQIIDQCQIFFSTRGRPPPD